MAYHTGGSEKGPQIGSFVNWKANAAGGALGTLTLFSAMIILGSLGGVALFEAFSARD